MSIPSAKICSNSLSIIVAAFIGITATKLSAQKILEPPFGLRWGDSPEKLIDWSKKHALDLSIFIPGKQPGLRVVRIQPEHGMLPDSPASALEGKFLNGGLYEMTVHYTDPEASAETMETRFEKLRKQITLEQGELKPNQQRRVVSDQFVTRTQAFHKEAIRGVFLLIAWTEVEDLLRKTREARFSLIYRNDNFREELAKKGSLK